MGSYKALIVLVSVLLGLAYAVPSGWTHHKHVKIIVPSHHHTVHHHHIQKVHVPVHVPVPVIKKVIVPVETHHDIHHDVHHDVIPSDDWHGGWW
ncbi:hypothetical protein ABEB36_001651 [Hypothenemus hampei]|uniref:Uncharacterized protein n=1 Tax=Hypothenemus hampei TaxID=57062 RepID=A0ABD1FG93_HYPHA